MLKKTNLKKPYPEKLVLNAGRIGAVCLSFLILPDFIAFTEDLELAFSTFETSLYLRIFFSWCSILMVLQFIFKATLTALLSCLNYIKSIILKIFSYFLLHNNQSKDSDLLSGGALSSSFFNLFNNNNDPNSSGGKSASKGNRFLSAVLPKKIAKRFKVKLRSFGHIGFSNRIGLWGFKLNDKYAGVKKTVKTIQKVSTKKPLKKIAKKTTSKIKKTALKKVKLEKAPKVNKTTTTKPKSKEATKKAFFKSSKTEHKKGNSLIKKTEKDGKAYAKKRSEEIKKAAKIDKDNRPKKPSKAVLKEIAKRQAKETGQTIKEKPTPLRRGQMK